MKRISAKSTRRTSADRRQVNLRIDGSMYRTLSAIARQERRSVSQQALHLLEDGLSRRISGSAREDDTPTAEVARLAMAGDSFDWLADEPDLYDEKSGEPL